MTEEFRVSVITSVYNAAEFVTRAVESALQQPETGEVLLVEDGSPDNSLGVCQELAEKYEKVKLLRHPNGENRGAGASRNLGMQNASCEYIGFVDADNYYLPDRFAAAKQIFKENPDCEGVYEAIGMHVENAASLQRWIKSGRPVKDLKTLSIHADPERLAGILISGGNGGLTLDGLVLKRSILDKSGYMAEGLKLHQDSDFIIRVAAVSMLLPGRLDEPVAMRGVHDHNRLSAPRSDVQKLNEQLLMWKHLYDWCSQNGYFELQEKIMPYMVINFISEKRFGIAPKDMITKRAMRVKLLIQSLFSNPNYLMDKYLWQSLFKIIKL